MTIINLKDQTLQSEECSHLLGSSILDKDRIFFVFAGDEEGKDILYYKNTFTKENLENATIEFVDEELISGTYTLAGYYPSMIKRILSDDTTIITVEITNIETL